MGRDQTIWKRTAHGLQPTAACRSFSSASNHSPDPHSQRPAHATNRRRSPRLSHARRELTKWRVALCRDEGADSGPGSDIANELIDCPIDGHVELRRGDLREWKIEIAVAVLGVSSLPRPPRAEYPRIEVVDHRADWRIYDGDSVREHRDGGARPRDPSRFDVEWRQIEPVRRLCHRDQIDGRRRDLRSLRWGNEIRQPRMRNGVGELFGTGVGGDDLVKPIAEENGELP